MSTRGSSPEPTNGDSPTVSNSSSTSYPPTRANYATASKHGVPKGESPTGPPSLILTPSGGFMVSKTSTNQRMRHDSTTSPPMGPMSALSARSTSPLENNGLPDFALPPSDSSAAGGSTPPPSATAGLAAAGRSTSSDGAPDIDHLTAPYMPKTEQRARSNSRGSNGGSPVPVPLITPKYQKKERQFNEMNLTDTASSAEKAMSATEMLRQRSKEALTIRSGKVVYGDTVDYHAYSMFRHGRHQYHTQSVGYSSDGDLVMNKEEISSSSEAEPGKFDRQVVHVTQSVCLDPYKRRALTDDEAKRRKLPNASRLKKYPGIKAPKNKKVRNRLANDHLANELGRDIYNKMRKQQMATGDPEEDDDCEGFHQPAPALFPSFAGRHVKGSKKRNTEAETLMEQLIHKEPDQIDRTLKSRGVKVSPSMKPSNSDKHPDSGAYRFMQLSQRLKDELKRAVKTSEQLIEVINDLETKFGQYILDCEEHGVEDTKPVELFLHDSYCRLLCHGVAGFYKLLSSSEDVQGLEGGVKKTLVQHPKVTPKKPLVNLPLQSLMGFLTGKATGSVFSLDANGENPTSVVGGGVIPKKGGSPTSSSGSPKQVETAVGGGSSKSSSAKASKGTSPIPQGEEIKDGEEDPVYPMNKTQQKKLKKLRKGVNVPMQGAVRGKKTPSPPPAAATTGREDSDEWEDIPDSK